MRLRDRNQAVPGGFRYKVPETGDTVSTAGHFSALMQAVRGYYTLKNMPEPDNLVLLVEDYVCEYSPAKYCRYTGGLGDIIAKTVSIVAGAADAVLGTELKAKAKRCGGCNKRRKKLNALTKTASFR